MFNLSPGYLEYNEKVMILSRFSNDYLNIDAIFSDETSNYRIPQEPAGDEPTTIKIRIGKDNVDSVILFYNGKQVDMFKTANDDIFDYFETTIPGINKKIYYYFKIVKQNREYYYNKQGVTRNLDCNYNFVIYPDFKIPDWAKGAVMYQIYVDRFYNGDSSNDIVNNEYAYLGKAAKHIEKWEQPVANEDICNFYGGDLKGVMEKMLYLKNLGVEVIYFNPIFVSPSNHKYDIQDYDYVDPHYGVIVKDGGEPLYFERFHNRYATMYIQRTTDKENLEASNKLMIELIKLAHENGIRIILDGVFNHCGAFNKWLDKEGFYSDKSYPVGAYKSEESIYNNYFRWYDKNWPNNDCYDSWWGHDNHPKLNYEGSKELYDYIISVGEKWVSPPYNADGWRLDVAADLGYSKEFNHKFWKDFRNAVKKANPDAIIIAEHYGDASDWLQGDQWDTVMNYDAFMEPITWFLTGVEKHSEQSNDGLYCNAMNFENSMRYFMSRFSIQSLQISMNELSNHDHSRFLTRTNRKVGRLHTMGAEEADKGINKAVMKEAVTFQMTWPGAPTIYYGDEAGLTGWTDPDNRRTYPWGREDMELLEYHRQMIKIHKKYEVLKIGSLEFLYSEYGIIAYGRWNEKQKIVVLLNNNSAEKEVCIPVWRINVNKNSNMINIITSNSSGYRMDNNIFTVSSGVLKVKVSPFSSMIFLEK